mmetsp:Transcript_54111/g.137452  ORF Transcript_54111/g.137452 Transcript_54111/m.137452 type:complete len:115 (-) Transcript_54111:10-354(-)
MCGIIQHLLRAPGLSRVWSSPLRTPNMFIVDLGIGQGALCWAARSPELECFVDQSSDKQTLACVCLHDWTEGSIVTHDVGPRGQCTATHINLRFGERGCSQPPSLALTIEHQQQ